MEFVKGCGKEAEIEVNDKGGKQSKTEYALHLLDGKFLQMLGEENTDFVFDRLGDFFQNGNKAVLLDVVERVGDTCEDALLKIGEVLKEGAEKYTVNNWRLISQEEHINHALIHYIAWLKHDTQDNHLGHFLTRIMMAYATEKSEKFSYTEYIG